MVEIAVVVEAEADAKIVCALADRLLLEEGPSWIEDRLTGGNHEREEKCWKNTPLMTLRERGEETMLIAYFDEVGSALLPLFSK